MAIVIKNLKDAHGRQRSRSRFKIKRNTVNRINKNLNEPFFKIILSVLHKFVKNIIELTKIAILGSNLKEIRSIIVN
jgi:hypothetical protein